jgi:hypothetical protein
MCLGLQRFYPLFGQLANLAPIAAGQTVVLSAYMTDPKVRGHDKNGHIAIFVYIHIYDMRRSRSPPR